MTTGVGPGGVGTGTVPQAPGEPGAVVHDVVAARMRPARTPGERVAALLQRNAAPVVLVVVGLFAALTFEFFLTTGNLRDVAVDASFLALIAYGMTFVIVTGGIDLSVGSVFALGGVLAAIGAQRGPVVGLLLPLGVCAMVGLLQGLLIARAGMPAFIVTLAGLLGVRGLVYAVTDEGATTNRFPTDSPLLELGRGTFVGVGRPTWIALALFVVLGVLLTRTRFGLSLFAIGGRGDAARLMGVPVERSTTLVYVLSATLAGFAGMLVAAQASSGVPNVGVGRELDAIAAVVIGGTLLTGGAGTLFGTLCGVLLLKVIQNIINLIGTLNSSYQSVVSGVFLVVVVVIQTLLSRRQRL